MVMIHTLTQGDEEMRWEMEQQMNLPVPSFPPPMARHAQRMTAFPGNLMLMSMHQQLVDFEESRKKGWYVPRVGAIANRGNTEGRHRP